jgi:ubiquinone/menaquinone biosynthesis C-methylase UbiE
MYSLWRRTQEVQRAISLYGKENIRTVLDIGTADGLMLKRLDMFLEGKALCVGIELSMEILLAEYRHNSHLIRTTALKLPFADSSVDVVIATAVIEHVSDPKGMMSECYRVMKKGGICVFTTPDPFFEKIAVWMGHINSRAHNVTFRIPELEAMLRDIKLEVLNSGKFMLSPLGFPFERAIEGFLGKIHLDFLFLNQIVVGRKV